MSVINWGKPKIEVAPVASDGTIGEYKEWPTPVEDTTQLTTELGDELLATEEGGEAVDRRRKKGSATLELALFVKKGENKPIEDEDGIVPGNHAVRLTPEDPECEGRVIEKSTVTVTETWNSAEGSRLLYSFAALKPKTGAMVKPYLASVPTPPVATPASVTIAQTGETQNVTFDKAIASLTPTAAAPWLTVAGSGTAWTLTAADNSTGSALTATLTATATDGSVATVTVTQPAA
ncbi:hypothetical protein [Alistipes sp.]|uniref:hypothetical protein n=1 Tax=Alistipes sp. TaxID=1872444 RepID=UPI0035288A80